MYSLPILIHGEEITSPIGLSSLDRREVSKLSDANSLMDYGKCFDCGNTLDSQYGKDTVGNSLCYPCCAERDRKSMIETGRATMYLVKRPISTTPIHHGGSYRWYAVNWPGTLEFHCPVVRESKTAGFGGMMPRFDASFIGPDGFWWHGRQQGWHNEILGCRRTKQKVKGFVVESAGTITKGEVRGINLP